jgi:hypothetical protein
MGKSAKLPSPEQIMIRVRGCILLVVHEKFQRRLSWGLRLVTPRAKDPAKWLPATYRREEHFVVAILHERSSDLLFASEGAEFKDDSAQG